jgi:magnesium transporter
VSSTVVLLPTLVASIYGMNFKSIPEREWAFGYPYALCLIVIAAVLPYLWFRRLGWL